jgi:pimeloyl-ACP methyl ester carboxylesterase
MAAEVTPAGAEAPVWASCAKIAVDWDQQDRTTQCASVTVPLDYGEPDGRQISIAVSRIPATDPAHRRGALLINAGGPGEEGVTEPYHIAHTRLAAVGRDYDLIGFDTRGVVYSSKTECPELDPAAVPRPPAGLSPKAAAEFSTNAYGARLRTCAERDPGFARALTTENIARDMDRIREAIGERRISFFGKSWGTALGAEYRTLFGDHVDRMLLDSVMAPGQSATRADDQVAAEQAEFQDFADWIAGYDTVYHFGGDGSTVSKALMGLRDRMAAHPRPDGSGAPVGGEEVNALLLASRADWQRTAQDLVAIRDGGVPADAAAARTPATTAASPQQAPNGYDDGYHDGEIDFMLRAVTCNDSPANRNFERDWEHQLQLAKEYPVAAYGPQTLTDPCVHWPFPARTTQLRTGGGALQLVGHAFERNTPIRWAREMRATIGGSLLTVQNDVHASLEDLPCASRGVDFLVHGTTSDATCPGAPIPSPVSP